MSFKNFLGAALAGATLMAVAEARADGLVGAASDMPLLERQKLAAEIAVAKQKDPAAFKALSELKGYRPEFYRQYRNPIPEVGRELRRLGKPMLLPMLEALVFQAPDLHGASDHEKRALIEGLLGEVGHLRDARAAAALHALFARPQSPLTMLSIGRAMGRLCDAASIDRLRAGLSDPARRTAAIDGVGQCRTLESAKLLATELDAVSAPEEAAAIAGSLGTLGSSWAWEALGAARQAEGLAAREIIAAALVRGFVRVSGDEREAHRTALAMVEHPESRRIATAHRGAADETARRELDLVVQAIEARLAK